MQAHKTEPAGRDVLLRYQQQVDALERRVAELTAQLRGKQEEVDEALRQAAQGPAGDEASMRAWRLRTVLGLSPMQVVMMELLLSRESVSKEQFFNALYYGRAEQDQPDIKIIDVQMCKIRRCVRHWTKGGDGVYTIWGYGYTLQPPAGSRGVNLRRKLEALASGAAETPD